MLDLGWALPPRLISGHNPLPVFVCLLCQGRDSCLHSQKHRHLLYILSGDFWRHYCHPYLNRQAERLTGLWKASNNYVIAQGNWRPRGHRTCPGVLSELQAEGGGTPSVK